MEHRDINIAELLSYIPASGCSYSEWVSIGMALKDEGCDCSVWEEWSRGDSRYHAGECERKWQSFRGSAAPVTIATVVQMAKDNGWRTNAGRDYALDWDSEISDRDELVVVERGWVESQEFHEPDSWDPARQIIDYLKTLFHQDDYVGYVTEVWEKDGRYLPSKGAYDRTAGTLIRELERYRGDIGAVFGDYNPEAGAWIRFNPLDGQGVKNDNVTAYRYALVESDAQDLARQNAIIRELELPVACLVHSGGKSVHAIVHIDAPDYPEYRKRVEYLYTVCRKNGLELDQQNRNPSRLSRMPGVMRKGHKQFLIDTNIGKADFAEWREFIESATDDLPDPESMSAVWDEMPPLAPALIGGVLRQGHKMLLAGPSKAGKSFALIELTIAIAEGKSWLGFDCAQGRVLYVNLELDRASCLHRFRDVYGCLGWKPEHLGNIDIWNLRGKSVPMDRLTPKLIRRAVKKDYIAVIIDPIYKVITGDENSADQMANFCNQFDKVCTELGCATIYCHHHSKGAQGGKRSMDRASGSGVFARDPDALLDLIELEVSDDLRVQMENNAVCRVCGAALEAAGKSDEVSQDDLCSQRAAMDACKRLLSGVDYNHLLDRTRDTRKEVQARTAWRIEGTLREFPKFPPVNLWFEFPVHRLDGNGALQDINPDEAAPAWQRGAKARKGKAKQAKQSKKEAFDTAYNALCLGGDAPTVQDMIEYYTEQDENGEVQKPTSRTV